MSPLLESLFAGLQLLSLSATTPVLHHDSSLRAVTLSIDRASDDDDEDRWAGCGPGPVLIALSSSMVLVGPVGLAPYRVAIDELPEVLTHLKNERRDRMWAILQVEDDVDFAVVAAAIDGAIGVDMHVSLVDVAAPRFEAGTWYGPASQRAHADRATRRAADDAPHTALEILDVPLASGLGFRRVSPR